MKKAMQEAFGQLEGLWKKPQPRRKAPPARVQRAPDPSEAILQKYAGPPEWSGASVAWGPGRVSPHATDLEDRAAQYFSLSHDQILGVLGAGGGGPVARVAGSLGSFVHGYDWRSGLDIQANEYVRDRQALPKAGVHAFSLEAASPPVRRLHGLLVVEPVMTLASNTVIDWMRMSLEPDARIVLEEPSREPGHGAAPGHAWFIDNDHRDYSWMDRGEREAVLKRNGFQVMKVRETTGSMLRNLRTVLQGAQLRGEELRQAMEIAPVLEEVFDSFNEQLELAKNRLRALENGEIAVYRYFAIKQRAES